MAPTGARHAAISVAFLAVALALTVVAVQLTIQAGGDIGKIPAGLVAALDHSYFIGLMTNVLFAAVLAQAGGATRAWPWADHLVFWGLNLGAAAFIVVPIVFGTSAGAGAFAHPVAFTAPIMGLAALLAIATYSIRLSGAPAPMRAPAAA